MAQDAGIGNKVVRCGVGNSHGNDVTGAHLVGSRHAPGRVDRLGPVAGGEVDQPAVARPARHACRAGVLASLPGGDQKFDGLADQGAVVLEGDPLLQVDETQIAFLHNGFR